MTPRNPDDITPPEGTVAIVVDLRVRVGAIRVFHKESGSYLGGVGLGERGSQVIILWNSDWVFTSVGSLPVGYVRKKI